MSWYRLPELEGPNRKDKKYLLKICSERSWKNWRTWVAPLASSLLAILGLKLWHWFGPTDCWSYKLFVELIPILTGLLLLSIQARIARRYIPIVVEEMIERGEIWVGEPPQTDTEDVDLRSGQS